MKASFWMAGLIWLASPGIAVGQELSNDAILMLSKAGIGPVLIIEKINSAPCSYDVSINQIVALKQAGLPDEVLAAMVRRCASVDQQRGVSGDDTSSDPLVKHSPGIYLRVDWETPSRLESIRPSKASGTRRRGQIG